MYITNQFSQQYFIYPNKKENKVEENKVEQSLF